MDFTDFNTGKDDIGRRLDKVIKIFLPAIPLSNLYQSLRKNLIKVNGKKQKPDYKIADADLLSIADVLIEQYSTKTKGDFESKTTCDIKIKDIIVFENEHILVLNKPAGINVQKAKKDEISLAELVTQYYEKSRGKQSISFRPGPLHRIDKQTSGLICFSMSLEGAKWFTRQMKDHNIKKIYSATVEGVVKQSQTWSDYIIKEDEKGDGFHTVQVISGDASSVPQDAKQCITSINPVETFNKDGFDYTKCDFQIETGRQHQIRAQSAFHGHPLAGDTAYGAHTSSFKFDLCDKCLVFPNNNLGIPDHITIDFR